jgi:hypothetical protein
MSRGSIDYLGSRFCSFETNGLEVVTLIFASWNQIREWLTRVDALRRTAHNFAYCERRRRGRCLTETDLMIV